MAQYTITIDVDITSMSDTELAKAIANIKRVSSFDKALKAEAVARMTNRGTTAIAAGGEVLKLTMAKDRDGWDSKKFKADHPDLYEEYVIHKDTYSPRISS